MKIVVMFLALLMHSPQADKAQVIITKTNLRLLQNAVNQFNMDIGRLPTTYEGLSALVRQPANVHSWPQGGYLETPEVPKDAWGHEFVYILDPNLPQGFGIYSCGRDGVTPSRGNDRDDLSTWGTQHGAYDCSPGSTRPAMIDHALSVVIVLSIFAGVVLILWKGFGRERRNSGSS